MFTQEQILNLCYLAYGYERSEDNDEFFLENPIVYPFPYESYLFGWQPVPSYESLYAWVEGRKHLYAS